MEAEVGKMMLQLKIRAGLKKKTGEDAIVSKEHDVYILFCTSRFFLEDRKLILE